MANKKIELATMAARQMKIIRPELDEIRTAKVLAKGMTIRELEILVKNK